MSDTEAPRNDSGQFASGEVLTGQAALERDNGFVPLKEDAPETPEELTIKEAAAERLKQLSGSGPITTYTAGMPDNVTLSLDQAVAIVKDSREADDNQAEIDSDKALRKEVDKLRGETDARQPQIETKPATEEEEIERALKIPRVKAELDRRVQESDKQRQAWEAGIEETGKARVAALFSDISELRDLPMTQWKSALEAMSQREPARFRTAMSRLNSLAEVEALSNQIKTQKAAKEQAAHREYATRENQRFAELTKSIPRAEMAAIEAHVPKMLAEHGADVKQFLEAISNQSTFPRATAEALLVKAAKYDLMTKAARAVPARAPVPSVAVPGVAPARGVDRGASAIAALNAKLSKTGNIKDAAALLAARRGSKGR